MEMKNLFKKLSVGALAVVMVALACVSVFAADLTNMVFAGYDTTNPFDPLKVYNEVIGGKYTGKNLLVPVPKDQQVWKVEGYEAEFPHAGYSRLYLEGNKTVYTGYNGLFPQWETRRQDYFWEMKDPYMIYERQQTKLENKTWAWDYGNEKFGIKDSSLLFKTEKKATVLKTEYVLYGFGNFYGNGVRTLNANELSMYNRFGVGSTTAWVNQVKAMVLAERNAFNDYPYTDAQIAALIPVVYAKQVTAKFNNYNDDGLATKNFANEYLKHASEGWEWDEDTLVVRNDAKIEWTAPQYELAEPYRYYQFLVVNGVVMDGHTIPGGSVPYITRYTGGCATPVITWVFDHFEETKDSSIYEVVLRKFVDGKKTDVLRKPSGEYGKVYAKIADYKIELFIDDGNGNVRLLTTIPQGTPNNLGGKFEMEMNGNGQLVSTSDGVYVPIPYNFGEVFVPASIVNY